MDAIPHNLPLQLSTFIGREREIAEVQRLLESARLVTLSGAGGCGKTRLALEVASAFGRDALQADAAAQRHFADGVWLVEFSALADTSLVPQQVADVLGVREEQGRPLGKTLGDRLQDKQLLLLFDNCEHLIDACARLAEFLLQSCAGLRILVTSREALRIAGESNFRVPSLSLPTNETGLSPETLAMSEAARLFVDRAKSARADFVLSTSNVAAVARICARLDGMPLAIELAAARLRSLSVEQVATRLEDRFRLLTSGGRTAITRHQTLQAAIDWSYALLTEAERILLQRLSVFAGGWTLEAAEAICPEAVGAAPAERAQVLPLYPQDVLDLLTRLADKSLVMLNEQHSEMRYRMLETIRQYAAGKLAEARAEHPVRNRHLLFFAQWAETIEPKLHGKEQTEWFERLETDYDNLRAAMDWSILGEDAVELGLRLAGALWWFWWNRAHASEGQERLVRILSRAGAVEYSIAHVKALNAAAAMQWSQSHYADAQPLLQKALVIGRELADPQYLASSLQFLGVVAFDQGDYATARASLEEALAIWKAMGDRWGAGFVLGNLGDVAFLQDDYTWAQALGEEALSLLRDLNENSVIPYTYRQLGRLALYRGDYATAISLCQESLRINSAARDVRGMAACVAALAGVAAAQGQSTLAVHLLSAADAAVVAIASPFLPADRKACEHTLAILHAQLDQAAFSRAWAEGRALTTEQAIAEAGQVSVLSPHDVSGTPATESSLPAYPSGLSLREVEVLRLVAMGLTNAQIAERLVISPRTVNAHLRSIYGKLDVTTRTAAARFATENKLV